MDTPYTWTYQYSLYRHPADNFRTIFWALLATLVITWTIVSCINACENGIGSLSGSFLFLIIAIGGVVVLSYLGSLFIAFVNGGKYTVMFEMDDKKIIHRQLTTPGDRQDKVVKSSIVIALLTLGHGARTPFINQIKAKSRIVCTTSWSKVVQVVPHRSQHLICLKERVGTNKIYASDADYDFILNYIYEKVGKKIG